MNVEISPEELKSLLGIEEDDGMELGSPDGDDDLLEKLDKKYGESGTGRWHVKKVLDREFKLDRIKAIVERWDKPEYTCENIPLRDMLHGLRDILEDEA